MRMNEEGRSGIYTSLTYKYFLLYYWRYWKKCLSVVCVRTRIWIRFCCCEFIHYIFFVVHLTDLLFFSFPSLFLSSGPFLGQAWREEKQQCSRDHHCQSKGSVVRGRSLLLRRTVFQPRVAQDQPRVARDLPCMLKDRRHNGCGIRAATPRWTEHGCAERESIVCERKTDPAQQCG
jgi:hypothetical protein